MTAPHATAGHQPPSDLCAPLQGFRFEPHQYGVRSRVGEVVRSSRGGRAVSSDRSASSDVARPSSTETQHAIRLLVLLDACGEPVKDSDPSGTVKVIRSELRL